jgi:long-subunit acyl-CoA synthetase (AMP-forming)
MEAHPRWGIVFLAAQSAGAVIVPLDILHEAETLAGLILHSGCSFLIVSERLTPLSACTVMVAVAEVVRVRL